MTKKYVVKATSPAAENQVNLLVEGPDTDLLVEGAEIGLPVTVEGVAEEDLAAELAEQKTSFKTLSDNYNDCYAQLEAEKAKSADLQSKLDAANEEIAALKNPAAENTDATKAAENGEASNAANDDAA